MNGLPSKRALSDSVGQLVEVLRTLAGRELRTRYKGSFFGILWAVLSPLGTVIILQFVFSSVFAVQIPHFGAFIYSGLLPWVWFSTAVQSSAATLSDNRDLVRIPFFTKPLLPGVVTVTNFVLYLFALPVLLMLLVFDGVPITRALIALPAIWLVQGLLTFAVSVFIAAVSVLARDVQHLIGVVLLFWFYLTPIFYDLAQVPRELASWFSWNPLVPIVAAHRAVTLYGRFPDWIQLGYWALAAVAFVAVSLVVFRSLEDMFVEEA